MKQREVNVQSAISRKNFFRLVAGAASGLGIWIWYLLAAGLNEKEQQAEFLHDPDIPMGISWFGSYYLYRDARGVSAFSATCTHAGCRLGKSSGNLIRCNCHGSQFEAASGQVVRGPAYRPLQQLSCTFDAARKKYVVQVTPSGNRNPQKS